MAWFANHYTCDHCRKAWTDEWSCMCDDDCPHCGARHMSPDESDDLSEIIEKEGDVFVVYWSPQTAEHEPDYRELGRFAGEEQARTFIKLYC